MYIIVSKILCRLNMACTVYFLLELRMSFASGLKSIYYTLA